MHKLSLLGICLTITLMLVLSYFASNIESPIKVTTPEFTNKQPSQIKCADFLSQSDAQSFFEIHRSDTQHLDKDGDGLVCEGLRK